MKTKKQKFFENNKTGYSTTMINYSGYGYGRAYSGMVNIYGYDNEGFIFDYIVTYHRSRIIANMIKTGEWWAIDSSIRSNYSTNGYNTRRGINRANVERCNQMYKSHNAILTSGKDGHDARVRMRN